MILNSNHAHPSFINIQPGTRHNNRIYKNNKIQSLEIIRTMQVVNVFIINIPSYLSF